MSQATQAVLASVKESHPAELKRELGLSDLTLFAVTCVTAARWVPIAAHAGPGSITLWLVSALFFVVPLTIAVATLVVKYPGTGGMYLWTRHDFGPWNAFFCFWVYWMGIAFLFPTAALLHTRVGFALLGPTLSRLGEQRFFLLGATLILLWIAIGSNLIGLNVGKWTENIGALATAAMGVLLALLAWVVWSRSGHVATPFQLRPDWSWGNLSFWAAIVFATSGMEGPGMMTGEIRDPARTMRRAGWIASAFATLFYISATASMLVILPPSKISELNGFVEIGDKAGQLLGTAWMSPLIAILVLACGLGLVGGIGTATSRMPFAAGVDALLPKAFGKIHPRWGTPYVSTLALGAAASLLLVLYQLGDTLRAAYDELVSMMVITGIIPYLYIFGSAWKAGKRLSAASGLTITIVALLFSVVPPSSITNVWLFEGKIIAGTFAVMGSAWVVYRGARKAAPLSTVGR